MARPTADPQFLALTGQQVRPSRAKAGPQELATSGKPKMPAHIRADDDACWEWRRVTKLLSARQTLTQGDACLVELHCVTYSRLRAALNEIKKYGAFEADKDGFRVESGASKLATKLQAQLRQTQIQMSLTPASRLKTAKTAPDPREAPPTPGSLRDLLQRAAAAIPEEEPDEEPVNIDDLDVTTNIAEGQ